ncbi:DUF420 domain-containing protein [Methylacidimicrobium sp. B4]|uniref:DUF420 domain-containing protein n=1 Tax=Methylacidimicrobium sp. B4 TaxID=2796139 RepID=UPI001A8D7F19|nr:DUF420 domain-containing protein [Methylacidimicrobium sp. B4]QSR84264.1 DUF420 domain-containing protein [Methylacidimicrobium sp. B4]
MVSHLPAVNASLNALTACFLLAGFVAIKRGQIPMHRNCMIAAFATSMVFLACYLVYHAIHGATAFPRHDWSRPLYFTILISHTFLAVVNLPAIFAALYLASKGRFAAHARVTRLLWPSWIYVSVTGVLVYFMLYHWFRASAS